MFKKNTDSQLRYAKNINAYGLGIKPLRSSMICNVTKTHWKKKSLHLITLFKSVLVFLITFRLHYHCKSIHFCKIDWGKYLFHKIR